MDMRRCARCHTTLSTTSVVCPACLSRDFEAFEPPDRGRLVSWTTIRRAPAGYPVTAPYDVVVVELDGGIRVTGRLEQDSATPSMNARVRRVADDALCSVFAVEPD
jgi:uncharacterized OB-fold protein